MDEIRDVRQHQQPAVRRARESVDRAFELGDGARGDRDRHDGEGGSRGLHRLLEQVGIRGGLRVVDERDPGDARRDLLERLKPLGSDRELEIDEAGDVAARTGQVRHQALPDRVGHLHEHDRHA
jgi:hypothetical protein